MRVGNGCCDVVRGEWRRHAGWARNIVGSNVVSGWANGADGGCWGSCRVAISGSGVFMDGGVVCVGGNIKYMLVQKKT